MRWTPQPTLVTLEGEEVEEYAELLGMDYDDVELLGRCDRLSADEIAYLDNKYPEYMGIWPIIAKFGAVIAKGVGAAVKGISKAVKRKRASRDAAASQANQASITARLQAAALAKQQYEQQQIAAQKAAQTKKLLMIGIPVAAIAVFAVMQMTKKPAPVAEKAGKK